MPKPPLLVHLILHLASPAAREPARHVPRALPFLGQETADRRRKQDSPELERMYGLGKIG